ncbi:hypothetical protein TeGR_g883, partial [Tetraparma gracilis]
MSSQRKRKASSSPPSSSVTSQIFAQNSSLRSSSVLTRRASLQSLLSLLSSPSSRLSVLEHCLRAHPPGAGSGRALEAAEKLYSLVVESCLHCLSLTLQLPAAASAQQLGPPAPQYNPLVKKKTPLEDSAFLSRLLSYIDAEATADLRR